MSGNRGGDVSGDGRRCLLILLERRAENQVRHFTVLKIT